MVKLVVTSIFYLQCIKHSFKESIYLFNFLARIFLEIIKFDLISNLLDSLIIRADIQDVFCFKKFMPIK